MATEEIRVVVAGVDKNATRTLDNVARAAENATEEIGDLDEASKKAGETVDGLGESLGDTTEKTKETTVEVDHLAESIAAADIRLKSLIASFAASGDVELFKGIKKERRQLRFLEGLAKETAKDAVQVGTEVGQSLWQSVMESGKRVIEGGGPYVTAGLVGLAAAAAPLIGASVGAAVLGGVGAGGVIGGIALASKDPRVQDAAKQLGDNVMSRLGMAGESFVAPVVESLDIIGDAFDRQSTNIGSALKGIAPLVVPLTRGLVNFAVEALPGITKGLDAAKPVLRALSVELPKIGAAVGDFVSKISDDTDGAVLALETISTATIEVLDQFGNLIVGLSTVYEWSVKATSGIATFMADAYGWLPIVGGQLEDNAGKLNGLVVGLGLAGDASGDFAGNLGEVERAAANADQRIDELTKGIDLLFGKTMDLDQATLAYKVGIRTLSEELTKGKRSLDENTEAGQENIGAVLDQINNINALREANAKSTMGIEGANRVYEQHIDQLRKTLLNLGYNKTAVNELIDRYRNIPKTVETTVNLKTSGSPTAWSMLRNQERGQPGPYTSIERRASGGPTRAGRTYLVGENGPELWSETANGHVTPAAQTAAMMSGASGGMSSPGASGGAVSARIAWLVPETAALAAVASLLVPYIQIEVINQGGDVVATLGRPER